MGRWKACPLALPPFTTAWEKVAAEAIPRLQVAEPAPLIVAEVGVPQIEVVPSEVSPVTAIARVATPLLSA